MAKGMHRVSKSDAKAIDSSDEQSIFAAASPVSSATVVFAAAVSGAVSAASPVSSAAVFAAVSAVSAH